MRASSPSTSAAGALVAGAAGGAAGSAAHVSAPRTSDPHTDGLGPGQVHLLGGHVGVERAPAADECKDAARQHGREELGQDVDPGNVLAAVEHSQGACVRRCKPFRGGSQGKQLQAQSMRTKLQQRACMPAPCNTDR